MVRGAQNALEFVGVVKQEQVVEVVAFDVGLLALLQLERDELGSVGLVDDRSR